MANQTAYYEKIKKVGERNAGVVTTKQIEEVGIYRGLIKKFVEDRKLVKETKGL